MQSYTFYHNVAKSVYICIRFQSEITKRYARSLAYGNVRNFQ